MKLTDACKEVSKALNLTINCLPGQSDVVDTITYIETLTRRIDIKEFPQSGYSCDELKTTLTRAVSQLNKATNDVVEAAQVSNDLAEKSRIFSQVNLK